MNYEHYILNTLLDKYERSSGFTTGVFKQKIAIAVSKDKMLRHVFEDSDEKRALQEAVFNLSFKGLISYKWVKFEEGNLLDRLSLNIDRVEDVYSYISREGKDIAVQHLYSLVEESYQKCLKRDAGSVITKFLQAELVLIKAQKKGTAVFPDNGAYVKELLRILVWLVESKEKVTERLLSVELYNDSKYFEHHIKSRLLSVLRRLPSAGDTITDLSDEDLLLEYGISRWPEVYEFLGNIVLEVNGLANNIITIDCGTNIYGAYTDSLTVAKLKAVRTSGINRVLFIENKANYEWYKERKRADELVVYHGGHYGLMKGKWFSYIHDAVVQQNSNAEFYHWSDIDLGGFNIYVKLRKLIPQLQPYKMDCATYDRFVDEQSKPISAEYAEKLEQLLNKAEFAIFHDVIRKILITGHTVEQEQLICK